MQTLEIVSQPACLEYGYPLGVFFKYNNGQMLAYKKCREEFANYFDDKTVAVGLSTGTALKLNPDLIKKFWDHVEDKLKLPIRSEVCKTSLNNVEQPNSILVKLSPFWVENGVRRAIFTLFLRCSCIYYKGDFNNALNNYELTNKIISTLQYFLEGNVYPRYHAGYDAIFCDIFKHATHEYLVNNLAKSPEDFVKMDKEKEAEKIAKREMAKKADEEAKKKAREEAKKNPIDNSTYTYPANYRYDDNLGYYYYDKDCNLKYRPL